MTSQRIIIICRRYCPGEAWTNRLLGYAKGFAENGADVLLVYLICDTQRTNYDISIPGVTVINLWETDGWIARKNRSFSYIINILRVNCLIRKGDILFTYGYEPFLMWRLTHLHKDTKVFCEITEHPYVIFSRGKNKRNARIQNYLLKKLDGLFVITEELRSYFLGVGFSSEKIHIINMFVDASRFIRLKKTNEDKYIGYCGTISFYKDGVDCLIKAFARFTKTNPDYKLYLIGGFESDDVEEKTKTLINQLNINDNVILAGRIQPERMPQLLFNAEILALARPDNLQSKNGFPTKLGEYLATGNPVVVTRVGEIPKFIKHQYNGLLCDPCSFETVAEQLCWIASHPSEARDIGRMGQELCFNEFSNNVQAKRAMDIMVNQ